MVHAAHCPAVPAQHPASLNSKTSLPNLYLWIDTGRPPGYYDLITGRCFQTFGWIWHGGKLRPMSMRHLEPHHRQITNGTDLTVAMRLGCIEHRLKSKALAILMSLNSTNSTNW